MRRCGTSRAGRTFVARKNAVRRRASAAVWCSLAAFPILLMVAGVHDYARLLRSRADLERALDAAERRLWTLTPGDAHGVGP